MKMSSEKIKAMHEKVMATATGVYKTKIYQYWINGDGHLCRAYLSGLDTMAMYEPDAIEVLD